MTVTRELKRRLRFDRSLPRFDPCLPRPAKEPPAGPGWIHEIKHHGFRIVAQRERRPGSTLEVDPVASFTMKHALLCSSTIQGGGKRRAAGME
jgi:hypothetical protein